MKKRIFIPIILLIICLFLVFISLNVYEEYILTKEITNINEIISKDNINTDKFKNAISHYKTKYEYKKLEKAYKNTIKDRYEITKKIDKFYKNEDADSYMSVSSISKLDDTKEKLDSSLKEIKSLKSDYENTFTDKYIKSHLKEQKPESFTTKYFNKNIFPYLKITSDEENLIEEMEKTIYMYNEIYDILIFLGNHKSSWEIEGDYIEFDNQEVLNQYNLLLENI